MGEPEAKYVTGHLWIEEGETRHALVAEVAPVVHVDRTYSFVVPEELAETVTTGQRVLVPLGRKGRTVEGFVVAIARQPWDSTLRPLHSVIERESFLTPELVALGCQMAEHYCCRLGLTLKAMTAEAVRLERGLKTVRYVALVHTLNEIEGLGERISPKRRAVLEALADAGRPMRLEEVLEASAASAAILRAMEKSGWVAIDRKKEVAPTHDEAVKLIEPDFELNAEQAAAVARIEGQLASGKFSVSLLFGVSGSGKTEVYIHAIRGALAMGRQAILLVPEILLTTQLVSRISSRLPDVAVSHSGLSEVERSLIWRDMASGKKRVAVGTRSAAFAPFSSLGLIVVDEEQETSYKNLRAPRFHVRDAAIMRARALGIPVVLGSATPSLETWYRSGTRSDYQRIFLPHRVKDLPMPRIHVVDMRDEYLEQRQGVVLSRLMLTLLGETLSRNEQGVVLMNRRGFATRVFCPACDTRLACPNCSVGLVMHTAGGVSICHYCRERAQTPETCPNVSCGERLVKLGAGTQQVEDILRAYFSKARIERVDRDTMKHRRDYERIVERFARRDIDVLVGTQMIAKGLDFPGVSFVGVVSADATGFASDFRAHERLFQLITQVAGRAGRAEASGNVVVQTMAPALPSLRCALGHDYVAFAEEELPLRKQVGLPPFRRLARLTVSHAREETARAACEELAQRIREAIGGQQLAPADVLGPNVCMIARMRKKYRFDLLVRAADAMTLRRLMNYLANTGRLRTQRAEVIIDVDPVNLA